ncbi:hypothetical protein HDU76_006451 [Blyttiomyces sp. JEL0837]|nr:hypothetical protein HDU76_006451 [Blyttiomyces sp. JEL0837]
MIYELHALDSVAACLESPDYRVISLSLRFLSHLVANDTTGAVFPLLSESHSAILQTLLQYLRTRDTLPQLRFACIETLHLFVLSRQAAEWLLATESLVEICVQALLDPILYVSAAVAKLLTTIILSAETLSETSNPLTSTSSSAFVHHELFASILVSGQIYDVLRDGLRHDSDSDEKLAGLELIWLLADSKSMDALRFLKEGELIRCCCFLLNDSDRLTRSRALDILKVLFSWAPDIIVLCQGYDITRITLDEGQSIRSTVTWICEQILIPELSSGSTKAIAGLSYPMSILQLVPILASRTDDAEMFSWILHLYLDVLGEIWNDQSQQSDNDASLDHDYGLLAEVHELLVERIRPTAGSRGQVDLLRRRATCDILESFKTLFEHDCKFEEKSVDISINLLQSMLTNENIPPSARLLDNCADIVVSILGSESLSNPLLQNTLQILVDMFKAAPKFATFKLLYRCVLLLFNQAGVEELIQHPLTDNLLTVMNENLQHDEWTVRDSTVEVFASFFLDSFPDIGTSWALKFDFPSHIYSKSTDLNPYVRSTAVKSLELIARSDSGWKYLSDNNIINPVLDTLVTQLVQDPEPLVRQSAVDLMTHLIGRNAVLICSKEFEKLMSDNTMEKLLDDDDAEVRGRTVKLVGQILLAEVECRKLNGNHEQLSLDQLTFYSISLRETASSDSSRLVKLDAIAVIHNILSQFATSTDNPSNIPLDESNPSNPSKRKRSVIDDKLSDLIAEFGSLDLNSMVKDAQGEHLYAEALEFNNEVKKITMQDGQSEGGDEEENERQVMNCYDC